MNGFRLFLLGRGLGVAWLLSYLVIVVAATVLTRARLGTYFVPEMDYDDVAEVATTVGVIGVSALVALLLKPEVGWRETTAARRLRTSRALLVLFSGVALCWPLVASADLAAQHIALGVALYGLSCLVSLVSASWVAAPHLLVLLVSLIPKLIPPQWSPFTPAQRDGQFLAFALAIGCAGAIAAVLKTDPAAS